MSKSKPSAAPTHAACRWREALAAAPPVRERTWRDLRASEARALERGGNTCPDWDQVRVAGGFDPALVRNCRFAGTIYLALGEGFPTDHDGRPVPPGLSDASFEDCALLDAAVHRVGYLARCVVRAAAVLEVDELLTTEAASFGLGLAPDGHPAPPRLALANEAGGRSVPAFEGITVADAYLWAKHRDDAELLARFEAMARPAPAAWRPLGEVGPGAVLQGCRSLRNVRIGPGAKVLRVNRLHDVTVASRDDAPAVLADGVQLAHALVGAGCEVRNAVTAERVVLAPHSRLLNGCRVFDTLVGENATIACGEVISSLLYPFHEQHHNNSFLIATRLMGQSNIAAGATIGSNHNSRAADGEIAAGRGFWPGLCVSLKHDSRFASFTLLAKGAYPAELDVPLPFSLVSSDEVDDRLVILPAFWWTHNLYALVRNAGKFAARDRRRERPLAIECDFLAPDTAEEMLAAMRLLETWTAQAYLRQQGPPREGPSREDLATLGPRLLRDQPGGVDKLEVLAQRVEHARRKVLVVRAGSGWQAYREMLNLYAVRSLLDWLDAAAEPTLEAMHAALAGPRETRWENLGGQLVPGAKADALRADVRAGRLADWDAVHARYRALADECPADRGRHAYAVLLALQGIDLPAKAEAGAPAALTPELWRAALDAAETTQRQMLDRAVASRRKDYENPFRQLTYDTPAERDAVLGRLDDNAFLADLRAATEAACARLARAASA